MESSIDYNYYEMCNIEYFILYGVVVIILLVSLFILFIIVVWIVVNV